MKANGGTRTSNNVNYDTLPSFRLFIHKSYATSAYGGCEHSSDTRPTFPTCAEGSTWPIEYTKRVRQTTKQEKDSWSRLPTQYNL